MCKVSLAHCSVVLIGMRSLALAILAAVNAAPTAATPVLNSMVQDVHAAFDAMNLRPTAREFMCCPKCYACYVKEDCPDTCTSVANANGDPCGRRLLSKMSGTANKFRGAAAKRYLHHDMKEWLGKMLSRPGMEQHLDRDVYDTGAPSGEMHDIWDGDVLRHFKTPDGHLFVKPKHKSEGRYIFSLNMDGFNPLGGRKAGKAISTQAIYMACLNLPPHLRHRPENIFLVGLIPGPAHPVLTQINHFLRILVDELLVFWNRGVYYSRTPSYPDGRLIRCALIPVICDLPAARQILGFASHSATNFCNFCRLPIQKINNVDPSTWPPGYSGRAEYCTYASAWRDAGEAERCALFNETGIRWTELLRLPYWDPTRYIVLDTMHLCYLGNYQRHCRVVWGMSVSVADGDGLVQQVIPDEEMISLAWEIVRGGTDSELQKIKANILRQICTELSILERANKAQMISGIKRYVSTQASSLFIQSSTRTASYGWTRQCQRYPCSPKGQATPTGWTSN